jgi:crossover junction endodeoxyribonuclease RuvC
MRILGIDPGSRLTGYGCIDLVGNQMVHVASGTLRLSNTGGKAVIPLEERLLSIHDGLSKVIREFKPQVMAIERVFFAKNAVSALKLGQARGAAILTGMLHSLKIFEYSASEVKAAVVGHGQADKNQVARMVKILIGEREFTTSDASDGLALAICHAQSLAMYKGVVSTQGNALAEVLRAAGGKRTKKRMSMAESLGISLGKKTEKTTKGLK